MEAKFVFFGLLDYISLIFVSFKQDLLITSLKFCIFMLSCLKSVNLLFLMLLIVIRTLNKKTK